MNRLCALWILAAIVLPGCHGQGTGYDPFGRTTIPAPGTGAASAPLYVPQNSLPPPVAPAPALIPVPNNSPPLPGTPAAMREDPNEHSVVVSSAPAGGAAGPAARLQPVPAFDTSATAHWSSPGAASAAVAASGPVAATATPQQVVVIDNSPSGEPMIRVEEAARAPGATPAAAAGQVTDLANLPPVTHSETATSPPAAATGFHDATQPPGNPVVWASHTTTESAAAGTVSPAGTASPAGTVAPTGGEVPAGAAAPADHAELTDAPLFRPAAASAAVSPSASTAPIATGGAAASVRYGHAPDYSSLHGRLEYSTARQQWKLRYLPIDIPDGQVDQYGGSVVLNDSPELKQYHDGDFVSIDGSLGKRDPNSHDFAPHFDIRQIKRLD